MPMSSVPRDAMIVGLFSQAFHIALAMGRGVKIGLVGTARSLSLLLSLQIGTTEWTSAVSTDGNGGSFARGGRHGRS